jgi:hypothetical protein
MSEPSQKIVGQRRTPERFHRLCDQKRSRLCIASRGRSSVQRERTVAESRYARHLYRLRRTAWKLIRSMTENDPSGLSSV